MQAEGLTTAAGVALEGPQLLTPRLHHQPRRPGAGAIALARGVG